MIELVFNPVKVHESLKADLLSKTTPVNVPEGDAELPDDGLPEDIEEDDNDSGNDTEEED